MTTSKTTTIRSRLTTTMRRLIKSCRLACRALVVAAGRYYLRRARNRHHQRQASLYRSRKRPKMPSSFPKRPNSTSSSLFRLGCVDRRVRTETSKSMFCAAPTPSRWIVIISGCISTGETSSFSWDESIKWNQRTRPPPLRTRQPTRITRLFGNGSYPSRFSPTPSGTSTRSSSPIRTLAFTLTTWNSSRPLRIAILLTLTSSPMLQMSAVSQPMWELAITVWTRFLCKHFFNPNLIILIIKKKKKKLALNHWSISTRAISPA